MIRLYAIPVSTSCARTRIVLDHKAIAYDELPPPDGYASNEYKRIIATGTVPGMVIDDLKVSDSATQVELLEELFPDTPMMPTEPFARARVRSIAAFHDTRLEPSVRALFGLVKPVSERKQAKIETGCSLFAQRLEMLDQIVTPSPFLAGQLFSHADAAFPTTLRMGMSICDALNYDISLTEKLKNWLAELNKVPAVKASLDLNTKAVSDWISSKVDLQKT
ncbi:MAG: glutathione S-transferase family protein [Alphaproteobacteria bacterium]